MQTKKQLVKRLETLRADGMSYQAIGEMFSVNRGIIHHLLNKPGYEPMKPTIRRNLDLPILSQVMLLGGSIHLSPITLGSRVCECGQAFIPNHGLRKKCFTCSPFKPYKPSDKEDGGE